MSDLGISRLHFPVTTLGPGQRIGIWVQGCSIRCPGCVSADTWAKAREPMALTSVIEVLASWLREADGITISGGEPLEQSAALMQLLTRIRPALDGDVLVYSGQPLQQALDDPLIKSGLVDAIIPEPYRQNLPQTRALRGSDNQPLVPLTDLGHQRYREVQGAPAEPALDLMVDEVSGQVWLAGIPTPGSLERLAAMIEAKGGCLTTSADKRRRG